MTTFKILHSIHKTDFDWFIVSEPMVLCIDASPIHKCARVTIMVDDTMHDHQHICIAVPEYEHTLLVYIHTYIERELKMHMSSWFLDLPSESTLSGANVRVYLHDFLYAVEDDKTTCHRAIFCALLRHRIFAKLKCKHFTTNIHKIIARESKNTDPLYEPCKNSNGMHLEGSKRVDASRFSTPKNTPSFVLMPMAVVPSCRV